MDTPRGRAGGEGAQPDGTVGTPKYRSLRSRAPRPRLSTRPQSLLNLRGVSSPIARHRTMSYSTRFSGRARPSSRQSSSAGVVSASRSTLATPTSPSADGRGSPAERPREATRTMAVDRHVLRPRLNPFIGLRPTPRPAAFLLLPHREALYGGAVGGGKSLALLMAGVQYVDLPRYHALILRESYPIVAPPV